MRKLSEKFQLGIEVARKRSALANRGNVSVYEIRDYLAMHARLKSIPESTGRGATEHFVGLLGFVTGYFTSWCSIQDKFYIFDKRVERYVEGNS